MSASAVRAALTGYFDRWLPTLLPPAPGVCLVAVGSLARGECVPYGDIDLILLHAGRRSSAAVGDLAERVWYPIWDAGISLDHSVRTVEETVALASDDLAVAVGTLFLRPLGGETELAVKARSRIREGWRRAASRRVAELAADADSRASRFGELTYLIEGNLKESRGGLRDVQALQALAAAQLADSVGGCMADANRLLLDVRTELHRRSGRPQDRLLAQEQPAVSSALRIGDADALLRAVIDAARTISFGWEQSLRRIGRASTDRPGGRTRLRGTAVGTPRVLRRPLAEGIVDHNGEVALARSAERSEDPALALRAAAAAATSALPLAPETLRAIGPVRMPEPWPAPAQRAFASLLAAGAPAVEVFEALDRAGTMQSLIPEWAAVRSRPQRDPVHTYTVDRHLVQTVVEATALVRDVTRPDLLLLAALLHDIGKGAGRDHSVAGAQIARRVARRIGLTDGDEALVTAAVRHHLLLPDTATRRDLDDPATIEMVVSTLADSAQLLELLAALAVADGRATGPAAWTRWKAELVAELVGRVRRRIHGVPRPPAPRLSARQRVWIRPGEITVHIDGPTLTVSAPDRAGMLSQTAGVLAIHHLEVYSATVTTEGSMAIEEFIVAPRFGRSTDVEALRADLYRASSRALPLSDRLAELDRSYPTPGGTPGPQVCFYDGQATNATIIEVRAANAIGLLYRVASALERCGLQIHAARISTLGAAVVDAFYVTDGSGHQLADGVHRDGIGQAVLATVRG